MEQQVKDILSENTVVNFSQRRLHTSPEKNIYSALRIFKIYAINSLPVLSNNTPVGIVSLLDVVGPNKNTLISDVMSTDICTVKQDFPIAKAIEMLKAKGQQSLVVVDDNEKFICTLSLIDFIADISIAESSYESALSSSGLHDESMMLSKEIEETRDMILSGFAKLVECRHFKKPFHIARVGTLSKILAEELQKTKKYCKEIDEQFITVLSKSSPLHDIGKVGIPDNILFKNGSYNSAEFKKMKKHPAIGRDILTHAEREFTFTSFLSLTKDVVYSHHERFNGKGYPDGISGETIPLSARIVALVDAYDAITMNRPYSSARSHKDACKIIEKESGKQFDPDIVQAFMRKQKKIKLIKKASH